MGGGDADFESVLVVVEVDFVVFFVVADCADGVGLAFSVDFLGTGGFSFAAHVAFSGCVSLGVCSWGGL